MGIDEILNKLSPEQRAELQAKLGRQDATIPLPAKSRSSGVFEKYTPPTGNSFYDLGLDDLCKEDIKTDTKLNKKNVKAKKPQKPKKAPKPELLDITTIKVDTQCHTCKRESQVTLADMARVDGALRYTCEECSE